MSDPTLADVLERLDLNSRVHVVQFSPADCAVMARAIRRMLGAPVVVQPAPTGDGREVWPEVIASLVNEDDSNAQLISACQLRNEFGRAKYGRTLRMGDGRNHLVDALQELLDAMAYLSAHRLACSERGDAFASRADLTAEVFDVVAWAAAMVLKQETPP
jgi:hypothetical protein